MHFEVPLLARCCFCAPLRRGLLVWAYLKLVFNILVFGLGLILLLTFGAFLFFCDCVLYILAVAFSALILFIFDIIFNFVLIVGCHKKNTTLLRICYHFGMLHAVFFLLLGTLTIALLLSFVTGVDNHDSELWDLILILSSVCGIMLILHVYLILMIRSEILKLKPSGQVQFVNHMAEPKCVMQVDFIATDKNEMFSEKPLP